MERCEATVFGDRCHNHQCIRTGCVKREGKLYCKQHDPVAVEARQKAREAKWNREWNAKDAAYKKQRTAQKLLERKAALVDELMAAAKLAVLNFKRSQASGNFLGDDDHEAWTALTTVLAKAEKVGA